MNRDNEGQGGMVDQHLDSDSTSYEENDTVGDSASSNLNVDVETAAGHGRDLDSGAPGVTPTPGEFGTDSGAQQGNALDRGAGGYGSGAGATGSQSGIAGTGDDVGSETGIAGSGADNSLDSGAAGYGAEGEDFNS